MHIVYHHDKRSGLTYAYESYSHWDKQKKQSRAKRKLIGRVDTATGKIVPTDGRCRRKREAAESPPLAPAPVARRRFYGATYLLDSVAQKTGLTDDLRDCFPDSYKKILSIAWYMIMQDNSALYRFNHWAGLHAHPCDEEISSARSSELLSSISEHHIQEFFRLQAKRRMEDEYWAYDSTSISSYSEQLCQVQWGHNKEHDVLEQLNLLLVFGEQSGLPFYYRKLAGNIPDVVTVQNLLSQLDVLGISRKVKLVMDRGFYSAKNINALYQQHLKFLLCVNTNLSFVRKQLDAHREKIRHFQNFDPDNSTYGITVPITWDYEQKRPYKGDTLKESRRMYLHLYYSIERGADAEGAFDKRMAALRAELKENRRVEAHEKSYAKYFEISETPKRGLVVRPNEEAIAEAKRHLGYSALVSNEKMEALRALQVYRRKDVVEKAFGNIKERLNLRRLLVSSERSLDGKIFVAFVALIVISYLHQRMQQEKVYKDYSMQEMLEKLDCIECYDAPGHRQRIGAVLKPKVELYEKLGISPPVSL